MKKEGEELINNMLKNGFILTLILLSIFIFTNTASAAWHAETVDSTGDAGRCTDLALDTNNNPHIIYHDPKNTDLKYAYYNGTTWNIEKVANVFWCASASLALDTNNNPHISYQDDYDYDLMYAYYDGTSWNKETVDSDGSVGRYSSLALDTNNNPHISYYDGSNSDLKYAYYDGTTWNIQTVDSAGEVGDSIMSLALDTNNNPHISYYDDLNSYLKYAYWTGSTWNIESIDTDGYCNSLALDTNNNPHISYGSYGYLMYAYYDGTTWNIESVDRHVYYNSLALDTNNNPHISYQDVVYYELKYAYYDGTTWNIQTVDSAGEVGAYNSLALDTNNNPHISYQDEANGDLKYAYPDNIPPTVISSDPSAGATRVARNKVIEIIFSEPIIYGTKNIKLVSKSGTVIPITTSINGNVLTINHSALLATGTKYYVKLFTGCFTDIAGNNLAGICKSFTTTTDGTKPTIKSTNPANGATNISRSKVIKIYFSEPVVKGTMYIKLVSSTGTEITIKKTVSSTGTYMNLTHTAILKANTKYYVRIHTGSVTDKVGNPIAAKTFYFNTGS